MLNLATEIIPVEYGTDYKIQKISSDQRGGNLGYWQIAKGGVKVGRGNGPIVELEIVRAAAGAVSIEIWAHDMDIAQPGVVYPLTYFNPANAAFSGSTKLKDFYFRQYKWLDGANAELEVAGTVFGKRLHVPPMWLPGVNA